MADVPDDGLSASMYVHVLDSYVLFALAPFPRQHFDLHGVGAHEFGRQVAEYVEPFNAVAFVPMSCDGGACTGDQFEQENIRDSHMACQHRFDLVFRPHTIDHREGGVECHLVGTTRIKIEAQGWSSVASPKPLSIEYTNCSERVPNTSASRYSCPSSSEWAG